MALVEIRDMEPVTTQEYQQEKKKKKSGDIGERIVAGFMRAYRFPETVRTDWGSGQEQQYDYKAFFSNGWENYYPVVFEVKTESQTCGTGNLFLELVQLMAPSWKREFDKDRNWRPSPEQLQNANEEFAAEFGLSKYGEMFAAKGSIQVMRENPLTDLPYPDSPSRYCVHVLPVPYKEGVKVPIVIVPATTLLKAVDENRLRAAITASTRENMLGETQRVNTMGMLYSLTNLFDFDVFDETQRNQKRWYHRTGDDGSYITGILGKPGTDARLFWWDVDQGEDGYYPPQRIEDISNTDRTATMRYISDMAEDPIQDSPSNFIWTNFVNGNA